MVLVGKMYVPLQNCTEAIFFLEQVDQGFEPDLKVEWSAKELSCLPESLSFFEECSNN